MKWSIPERIIEQGRTYLQDGRVFNVVSDAKNQVWQAEVLGSELYHVVLDATAKEQDICSCMYWQEHHYCKHTVAVELYLRAQNLTRQITQEAVKTTSSLAYQPAELMTKSLRAIQVQEVKQAVPLQLQVQLTTVPTNQYQENLSVFVVSIKIGLRDGRLYVVKNIMKFLQDYTNEAMHAVNQNHQFQLTPAAFPAVEQQILTDLCAIAETQQLTQQFQGVAPRQTLDKKYLWLPPAAFASLNQSLMMLETNVLWEDGTETQLQVVHATQPLQFQLVETEAQWSLSMETAFTQVFDYYQTARLAETLYTLSVPQLQIVQTLQQIFKRLPEPIVTYMPDEASALFQDVLPLLREIGTVTIDETITEKITAEPLNAVFNLRKAQGKILLRVDYRYGDVVYSTDARFTRVAENLVVLRDEAREQQIHHLLVTLGFVEDEQGWHKLLPQAAALYRFFALEVPQMELFGRVRLGDKLRALFLDGEEVQSHVSVEEKDSWLNVSFDVTGIDENEIHQMLQHLQQGATFYTLQNGQILSLESEQFQATQQVLQALRPQLAAGKPTVTLPLNKGLQLYQDFGSQAEFSQSFQQMVYDLTHPENYEVALPKEIQATLRDYQVTGFKWFSLLSQYQFGGILADDMGLGKTLQTITYLLKRKELTGQLRTLIVAPASLIYNWEQEIARFAPTLSTVVVNGNKAERRRLVEEAVDIKITSYATLRQDIELYEAQTIDVLIMDEAQMVKNHQTKTAQALQQLPIAQRFALSGTPIENNLDELWSLFQLVMPGFLPHKAAYRQMSNEDIAQTIQPFVLRRTKAEVLHDLPEKIERNYYSGLTQEQKTLYLAYLERMRQEVSGMDSATFKQNRLSILSGLTRLRQICCDPKLFVDDYEGGSGKLEQLKELLEMAQVNGRRVLIFSQFTGMLTIIEEELAKMGLTNFYLRGSTPAQDRLAMVDAFNAGEKDVFLISLKAGGTGLNLTGADTVVLYDLWWNPAVEEQATSRAHRMGQKNVVEVWRLLAEGTVEEWIDQLQTEKKALFQQVLSGSETPLNQLTEDDIRQILQIGVTK